MAENAHVSHSQISCLLKCAKQYYFRYIERIKTPATPWFVMGGAYHAGIERNFISKAKTAHDLATEEVLDAYDRAWNERLAQEEVDWRDESPGEVKDKGASLLRIYMETTAPFVMPAEVEKHFSISLPGIDNYTLDGIIDLITADGLIVDHKTASRSKVQGDVDKDLQPSAYAAALFTDPMIEEVNFEFHVGVAKKSPEIQRIATVRNRADVEWYLNLVSDCLRQVHAGVFPPNPTSYLCCPTWCGYWKMCKGGAR